MIKIAGIKIYGFKDKDRKIEINFSKENISVIFGENGIGKTTFLLLLFAVFSQDGKKLSQENVSKIEIFYQLCDEKIEKITIKRVQEKAIRLVDEKEEEFIVITDDYDWSEYEESELKNIKSMFFGVQRGIQNQYDQIDEDEIYMFFRNPAERSFFGRDASFSLHSLRVLSRRLAEHLNSRSKFLVKQSRLVRKSAINLDVDNIIVNDIKIDQIESEIIDTYRRVQMATVNRIQNALFDTFSLAIDNLIDEEEGEVDDFNELLKNNSERLIRALEGSSGNKFTNKLIDIIKSGNIVEGGRNRILIKKLLVKMMKELEEEEEHLNSINELITTYNSKLSKGKEIFIAGRHIEVRVGDNVHSINELSSGERHLLAFLAYVSIGGKGRDFLIIDEPEISLNISWQRELLPLLGKLAPQAQIIVASHSPSISQANPGYLVELI